MLQTLQHAETYTVIACPDQIKKRGDFYEPFRVLQIQRNGLFGEAVYHNNQSGQYDRYGGQTIF